MKNYLFILFIISPAISVSAADIEITGPKIVCPDIAYTYTASASNIFGARNGCFGMKYWDDGAWVYPQPNFAACDCGSNSSTISYDITWTTTGNKEIEFWFLPDNNIDCTYDYESYFVEVRAVPPGEPTDSDGLLVFCTTNETKTITIPGIPWSEEGCNWHNKYDWIVPSGWSVVPATNSSYTAIPGGIRTFETSVNVTSQSTNLDLGSSGNYKIIVKSEPDWPYPVQSERTIWIGSPEGVFTDPSGIPAIEAVRGETINLNVISNNGSNPDYLSWSTNDPNALNLIPGYNLCAVECLMSGYNHVYVKSSNSCGKILLLRFPSTFLMEMEVE